MLGELVVLAIALATVSAVVARAHARRRRQDAEPAPGAPGEGTWTATGGPLGAAFPLERTPHERDIGDAAFVDGFVIGRYYAPASQLDGDRRTDGPPGAGGLEGDDAAERADHGADTTPAPAEADLEVDHRGVGNLAPGAVAWSDDLDDEWVGEASGAALDDGSGYDDGSGSDDEFGSDDGLDLDDGHGDGFDDDW